MAQRLKASHAAQKKVVRLKTLSRRRKRRNKIRNSQFEIRNLE
jgi:hypothetical protein